MAAKIEFHFQEGFTGETVVLSVNGTELSRVTVQTRLQTGLAAIEAVEIAPGRSATITIPGTRLSATHTVTATDRWITVNRRGDALSMVSVSSSPGYV